MSDASFDLVISSKGALPLYAGQLSVDYDESRYASVELISTVETAEWSERIRAENGTVTVSVSDISGLDIQSGKFEHTFPSNKLNILSFDTQGKILEGTDPTPFIDGNLISVAFAGSDPYSGSGDLLKIMYRFRGMRPARQTSPPVTFY